MNYEISFFDTDCEDFFCSIFSRNDLFSLIQETLEESPETKVIVLDPIDCEKDNYIEPLIDGIFPKGTKLYLPVDYLKIKELYNEEGWNLYPNILPPRNPKNPWSEWLVQKTDGTLAVAYYYNNSKRVELFIDNSYCGWRNIKELSVCTINDEIVAFKKLPERYSEK